MYPEYPQQNPAGGQDLMSKLMADKKRTALVAGGGFILLMVLIAVVASLFSGGTPVSSKMAASQAHMAALAELTNQQEEKLINGTLRERNATIGVLLAGAAGDFNKLITGVYGVAEPAPQVAAANAARLAEIQASLETAIASNTYDATYQAQMAAELRIINAQLADYSASTPASVDVVLSDIIKRLTEARKRLEKVEL